MNLMIQLTEQIVDLELQKAGKTRQACITRRIPALLSTLEGRAFGHQYVPRAESAESARPRIVSTLATA